MSIDSGRLSLDGDVLRYRSKTYGDWDLQVDRVQVIGEATNDIGPFADDYFYCFVIDGSRWYEASHYAEGCGECMQALFIRLGSDCQLRLYNSTSFASNILWPPELEGKPMFTYTDIEPETWFGKLINRLFGFSKNCQTFSDEVMAHLTRHASDSDTIHG